MTTIELDQGEINALNNAGHALLQGETPDLDLEEEEALESALQKLGRYAT